MQALTSPSSDAVPIRSANALRLGVWILRTCLLSLFLLTGWFWPVGDQYVGVPPSFACTTAIPLAEKTICADPLLEKVDVDHAVYFQDNLEAAVNFQANAIEHELKKSEAGFIASRDRCGSNRWCIEEQYRSQDMRIADMSGEPHRVTAPVKVYLDHYVGAYLEAWLRKLIRHSPPHPSFSKT